MRLCFALLLLATAAHADPVASGVEPAKRPPEPVSTPPTAVPTTVPVDDSTAAPSPTEASGVEREDKKPRTDRVLWIPRALLFVPRMVVWAAGQPVRGVAYAYERYDVSERFTDATFNDERTFGIYPVATYETGFGFTIGARLLYKNVFDRNERLKLRVNFGGRFRQAYGLNFRSGERFGERVALELDTSYERRPQERFYGIGSEPAIDTRFRETLVRNVATIDTRLVDKLHSRLSGALMLRDFSGTGEPDSLEMHYDTSQIVGWDGVDNIYVEHEFAYDSRRPASPYQSLAFDATGWLATAHIGFVTGVREDPSEHMRYGGEVQRYFDLYDGSRVLVVRALVDAVHGESISFIDLPRLGGSEYLRGYPHGRFRDKAVALGSVEYNWALGNYLAAFTFVDAGRAWPSMVDLDRDLRIGFGGGVQVHTNSSFMTRMQIAGSRDGDVFLELALSPAFGRRERAGRY